MNKILISFILLLSLCGGGPGGAWAAATGELSTIKIPADHNASSYIEVDLYVPQFKNLKGNSWSYRMAIPVHAVQRNRPALPCGQIRVPMRVPRDDSELL
jgi:hypothetical protein